MCENFGVDMDVAIPAASKQASGGRYRFRRYMDRAGETVGEMKCLLCGMSAQLPANASIRPVARHFLGLSLPFADCPNEDCPNHGVNVFEHWVDTGGRGRRRYRRERENMVRCRSCGATVSLGHALGVRNSRQNRSRWADVVDAVRLGLSVSKTHEHYGIPIGSYYAAVGRIGARLGDYHGYRNARLLRKAATRKEPFRVYTDVIQVSLQGFGDVKRRHALLDVIVSVTEADGKYFVLAAHPFFLPATRCPDEACLRDDGTRPVVERRWDCLLHPFRSVGLGMSADERLETLNTEGRGGYFVGSPYAQIAHFLVVRKMLWRQGVVHCCMDGAKELASSALIAFRDMVADGPHRSSRVELRDAPGRAEVVLYQHDKKAKHGSRKPVGRGGALDKAWAAAGERFASRLPELLGSDGSGLADGRVRAAHFRNAFRGAYSKAGGWAWLDYPPDWQAYRRCRTLWVTQVPGRTFGRHGKAAVADARMLPVDSIMNSMRRRIRSFERPRLRSEGRSFASSYVLPGVVHAELLIYLLKQNYSIGRRARRPVVPARAMGLMRANGKPPDLLQTAWDFRLGVGHAREISGWIRE